MKPDVVVDVGNSRIEGGRCSSVGVSAFATLPADEPRAWEEQASKWGLTVPLSWVLTDVHPSRCERLAEWLRQRGDPVRLLVREDLPLQVAVGRPDQVGLDRLLNAVAANSRRRPGTPAVVVDVGSAVTVDRVDREGVFRGGAILPGFRLMSQALHDYTALLPLVEVPLRPPPVPAPDTVAAIQAGVFHAVTGGVSELVRELTAHPGRQSVP